MEKPRAIDEIKRVDEVFEENAGEHAGEAIGNPANWAGQADGADAYTLAAGSFEQDPDALLATELLKKADREREKGSELEAN